jgi:hypothetical protein
MSGYFAERHDISDEGSELEAVPSLCADRPSGISIRVTRLSPGINRLMFCTDGLERMLIFLDVEARRIGTKDVDIVGLGKAVAELFEPNRRLRTLRPQQSNAFAANRNPGLFCLGCIQCWLNEVSEALKKSSCVGRTIDHECGEYVGSIQRKVGSLLNSGINIQAFRFQCQKKAISVWLRSKYNSRIPGL